MHVWMWENHKESWVSEDWCSKYLWCWEDLRRPWSKGDQTCSILGWKFSPEHQLKDWGWSWSSVLGHLMKSWTAENNSDGNKVAYRRVTRTDIHQLYGSVEQAPDVMMIEAQDSPGNAESKPTWTRTKTCRSEEPQILYSKTADNTQKTKVIN